MKLNVGKLYLLSKRELGYLISFYIGDGYSVYSKKDRHYRIEFHLNSSRDKDIINYLSSIITKLGLKYFLIKDKRSNAIKLMINSKQFMYFIEEKFKIYKMDCNSNKYRLGFISGFIDSEGYTGRGSIIVTQKDKNILIFINNLIKIYNLIGRIYYSKSYGKGGGVWRLRIPNKFKYNNHNSCKIIRMNCG